MFVLSPSTETPPGNNEIYAETRQDCKNKIWNQPNHERTILDNSSTDDFPIQPPIRQNEVVYLDSTTSKNADVPVVDISEDTTANNPEVPGVGLPENIPPISNH